MRNRSRKSSCTRQGSARQRAVLLVSRSVTLAATALLTFTALASAAGLNQRATQQREHAPSGPRILRGLLATTSPSDQPAFPAPTIAAGAFNVADPIAHVANANPVVPRFGLGFAYSEVHQGELKLKELLMRPVFKGEFAKGGCTQCTGSGSFKPYEIRHRIFMESTRGSIFLTRRTRIVEALIRPGAIGRFKIYGVSVGRPTRTVLLTQGCIAADAIPVAGGTSSRLLSALLHPRTLPQVPCQAGVPRDVAKSFDSPFELSTTASTQGTVSGRASGSRWLTIFQVHQRCAPNPLAESMKTSNHAFSVAHVSGGFTVHFVISPDTRPGFFCVYLQTGGKFANVPDGRVTLTGAVPYWAGDIVGISGPSTGAANTSVPDTFAGNASVLEELYVYTSFISCLSTAQAEYPRAGHAQRPVRGHFSIPLAIPLSTKTEFVCAYLQVGAPTNGLPTGPTLAAQSQTIVVP